jgi:ribosomal protein S18 acetylase RimI-like enzyme/N-acetylglutamate synthase-like GNAT family acetyltransferase
MHSTAKLSQEELKEISQLADLCNKHENIELKLNWNMLRERSGQETNDYMFYENGQLVGFLGIYQFRSTEVEISGMVHPLHRRKGIFGELVRAAKQECVLRGVPKLIFICQNGSSSGKAYLEALGAKYSFSEYWMQLNDSVGGIRDRRNEQGITLRLAESHDLPTIVRLNAVGFDMTEADALKIVEKAYESPSIRTYVAVVRIEDGSLRSVGKINVRLEDGKAFISGFVVGVDDRGRGYGRAILNDTVAAIKGEDETASIALEVAVENGRALGLYESSGFRVSKATDYYDLVLLNF